MKSKVYVPFLWLGVVILIVSLACGPTPKPTVEPARPTQTPEVEKATNPPPPAEPTKTPLPSDTPQPSPTSPPSGLVTNLQDAKKAIVQIEAQGSFVDPEFGYLMNAAGRGSGFIIDPSGLAVTNNHVVTGAALLKVWVGGDTDKTYNAKVLGVSECSDLALIDIEGDGFAYLEWYEGAAKVGLEVYAAGFPLGDPEFTLTKGIVSKEKTSGETSWASVDAVIEHDATINPGNSGGPLLDKDGKVVGVNYASYKEADQYFAIGRPVAIPVIDQLRTGKDVDSIGVNGQAVMSSDGSTMGIWVSSVKSGSPADKAGLVGGDIITTLEGLLLAEDGTMSQYCDILRTHNPGDTLSIGVLRWISQEYLEGQLNGRALAVSYSFANELSGEVSGGDTGGDTGTGAGGYSGYVTVTDDTGMIQMDVPAEWADIDGRTWSSTWGDLSFDAPAIGASADLDKYRDGNLSESGVFFAASERWGELGGYVNLLDGVQDWYSESCTFDSRTDYKDAWYEGQYDLWLDCGPNQTMALVLAARPIDNPTAYLLLLEIVITKDADLAALDYILQTFQANF